MTTKIQHYLASLLLSCLLLTIPIGLAAQSPVDRLTKVGSSAGYDASVSTSSIATTAGLVIRSLLSLLGVLFMAYVLWGGYIWLMAAGREDEIERAKKIIRGSIIGLVIVLGAYAITAFVISQLTTATGFSG